MLTAAKAREIVEEAVGENWTPASGGQAARVDLERFWHSFQRLLVEYLQTDPPAGRPDTLQLEGFLAMAGCVLLCRSFWILQAKGTWYVNQPHPTWRDLLDWFRASLDDLLRESRELGLQEKRDEQAKGLVPMNVVIPGPLRDWRDPV